MLVEDYWFNGIGLGRQGNPDTELVLKEPLLVGLLREFPTDYIPRKDSLNSRPPYVGRSPSSLHFETLISSVTSFSPCCSPESSVMIRRVLDGLRLVGSHEERASSKLGFVLTHDYFQFRYVFSADVVFTDAICLSDTIVIGPSNYAAFEACTSFNGSISFDPSVESHIGTISFNLDTIIGNLDITNGVIKYNGTLKFKELRSIDGSLTLSGLSSALTLSFPVLQNISSLTIWNNSMQNMMTFEAPMLNTIDALNVSGNVNLAEIDLSVITLGNLSISENDPMGLLGVGILLPNLQTIDNLNASLITGFNAPKLFAIYKSLTIYGSILFSLSLNILNYVGSNFEIGDTGRFTTLSLQNLELIAGDLILIDNLELTQINLPVLANVSGGISMNGNFSEYDFFPIFRINE